MLGGAGNDGPDCSSSVYPPAIYEAYFSVGATTIEDTIAWFSSRGPITVDGSSRMKPDSNAPGQNVRSCIPGNDYLVWSGTSFAGPHVAGLVALLISAKPELAGHVGLIEYIITETAVFLPTSQECGGVPGTEIPNNTYGSGRIDSYAAYRMAFSLPAAVHDVRPPGAFFILEPNFPNPFNPTTTIRYTLTRSGKVSLNIYTVRGELVRVLVDGYQDVGVRYVAWDGCDGRGRNVSSGIYFYTLKGGEYRSTRKMVFLQ